MDHILIGIVIAVMAFGLSTALSEASNGSIDLGWFYWFGNGYRRTNMEFEFMTWALIIFGVVVLGCLIFEPQMFSRFLQPFR